MRFKVWVYFLGIGILLAGCKTEAEKAEEQRVDEVVESNRDLSIARMSKNKEWVNLINSENNALEGLYTKKAKKIIVNEDVISGNEDIAKHHLKNKWAIKDIWINSIITANEKRGIEYEIGGFQDESGQKYNHVVIWEKEDEVKKRVFEFIEKQEKPTFSLTEISERRDDWIIYCNKHNAANLINELYSSNTVYFSHKPLVIGREALIKEYAYMNNEKYSLSLSPNVVIPVNQNFVFEIGQCGGSYNGKYLIVWKRNEEGKWEVFIDSNI